MDFQGGAQRLYPWALYPFDVTHLEALSIRDNNPESVPWELTIHKDTIRTLEIPATLRTLHHAIDLSSFPNLLVLRIALDLPISPMMLETLSTIAPWHRIHTFAISLAGCDDLDWRVFAPLDSILSALPVAPPPIFEIEYSSGKHEEARKCFRKLIARNQVCCRSPGIADSCLRAKFAL